MGFVDWDVAGAAVHLTRRRDHDLRQTVVACRGQNVNGTHRVDLKDLIGVDERIGYADQRSKMKDHVGTHERPTECLDISHVAPNNPDWPIANRREKADIVLRVVTD